MILTISLFLSRIINLDLIFSEILLSCSFNKDLILESLISFKRAGANAIISYYADKLDKILK